LLTQLVQDESLELVHVLQPEKQAVHLFKSWKKVSGH